MIFNFVKNQNTMLKYFLLTLSLLSFNNLSNENYIEPFLGMWSEVHSGEIVQIFRGDNSDVHFERFLDSKLAASGKIYAEEYEIKVERSDIELRYKLNYAFSPNEQVLSITKPNSVESWLLFRIR